MYSLTIIGGGAISCGYDSPEDSDILTHLHGALVHPDIKLDALVETDEQRQIYIRDKWGIGFEISENIQKVLEKYRSDIVVIATPTKIHLQTLKSIYDVYEPKLILCEKPVVMNLDEFCELENIQKGKNTKILTNYIRRFDPSLNKLKDMIFDNTDEMYHFYGTFTKGFLHNGSHMVDLISMLVGNISDIEVIDKKIVNDDIFGKFFVYTDRCLGVVSNIGNDYLSLFEFSLYTDKMKIEIRGSNQDIYITTVEKSDMFKSYSVYINEEKLPKTLNKYGYNTFDFAIKILQDESMYNRVLAEQNNINKFILHLKKRWINE